MLQPLLNFTSGSHSDAPDESGLCARSCAASLRRSDPAQHDKQLDCLAFGRRAAPASARKAEMADPVSIPSRPLA